MYNQRITMKNKRGFTLIELLVVISIIGLISTIVLASLAEARGEAQKSAMVQDLKQLQLAFEIYKSQNGYYPYENDMYQEYDYNEAGPEVTNVHGMTDLLAYDINITGLDGNDYFQEALSPKYIPKIPMPIILGLEGSYYNSIDFYNDTNIRESGWWTNYDCAGKPITGYLVLFAESTSYNFNLPKLNYNGDPYRLPILLHW
jgi:prepilin-type N-terminal cleavage/methylation domain-containing protein